jgi:acyl-CoA thioesterase-1
MNPYDQVNESVVLIGEEPHKLRYRSVHSDSVFLRSKPSETDLDNVIYAKGIDFTVNEEEGTIQRTSSSRIPDWSHHPLYGKEDFNHADYPDYSNKRYTLYVDYQYDNLNAAPTPVPVQVMPDILPRLYRKLMNGEAVTYVVFGDSISTGAEASEEPRKYYNLFVEALRERFPKAVIQIQMKAIGGETSLRALSRVVADVIETNPDLVTIGYGMNDQNKQDDGSNAVSLELYKGNIAQMIEAIQKQTDAELILITPCLPNPLWKYASDNVAEYAGALRELGAEYGVVIADLQQIWLAELSAGKTHESLLLNNVNHPNDYGHQLYAQSLLQLVVR